MNNKHLIGLATFLILTVGSNAQNNLCHNSFSFTAANSNVVINPNVAGAFNQLYNTGGYTWEAWFRLKAPIQNQSIIISVEDAAPYQDIFLGFGWGSTPNALSFHITDDGTSNEVITVESLQAFTLNTWYHVAGVCDYANASLKLYLDGTLIATQALTSTMLTHKLGSNHSAFIGNASASASGSNIDIDEVRFWNTARTTTEIQAAMKQCLSPSQIGLVAWFKADNGIQTESAVNGNFTVSLQNAGFSTPAPVDDCYTIGIGASPATCKALDFAGTVTSGITILDWSWDFGDGNTGSNQNTSHTYANFGSKHVTLTLKDNAGCGATLATDIAVNPSYVYDTKAVSLCPGENFMGVTRGVLQLTIPAPNGCDTFRSYILTVNDKPDLGADKSVGVCNGGYISLPSLYDLTGYSNIKWSVFRPTRAGVGAYTLQVTDNNGCKDTAVILVKQYLAINTSIDTALCDGVSIEGYTQPGTYTDKFRSLNGCDSIRVLNISACDVYFPNAFTPDGDGNNDVFRALNAINLGSFHLQVYNRYGQLLFETSDPARSWNGTVNGKPVANGSYIWYCEYTKRGKTQSKKLKGTTFVVR